MPKFILKALKNVLSVRPGVSKGERHIANKSSFMLLFMLLYISMNAVRRALRMMAVTLLASLACASALAQQGYPTKPVRLIVPFAPGGGTDIVARLLAQKLSEAFGQNVIVDNRAGGGGTMGVETTVRATPDGYTTIIMSGSYATNAAMYKLPYDPVNDIVPKLSTDTLSPVAPRLRNSTCFLSVLWSSVRAHR